MSKPRVFISSTYYDLRHVRASLDAFIQSLGFDTILSEKGNIAFAPNHTLDESCYKEVRTSDIFVMIIGGRYGTEKGLPANKLSKSFFGRYDSITKQEYEAAVSEELPLYILIEKSVYSEYFTFLKNKNGKNINYAHVDSINIFLLIQSILSRPTNPVHPFDKFSDIEQWLREQWAGRFKDLLVEASNERNLNSLSAQVASLQEFNITIKRYLEEVMSKVSQAKAAKIISSETTRLHNTQILTELRNNVLAHYINKSWGIKYEAIKYAVNRSKSPKDFVDNLNKIAKVNLDSLGILFEKESKAVVDYRKMQLICDKMKHV